MSFPVPVKYLTNDNQDATVVVYDDGKELEGLPDPGCFSQENVNQFVNRWVNRSLPPHVVVTAPLSQYSMAGNPFTSIKYIGPTESQHIYSFTNSTLLYDITLINTNSISRNMFSGCTSLKIVDSDAILIDIYAFYADRMLNKLILRNSSSVPELADINAFTITPFASGLSGGEIYIPKNLYDHLGDGSELDYKAAANWSTIDGYGTITWRQIEGSEYEFNYADGTPIGSV